MSTRRSFLVGLIGQGIKPSLTPEMHEREAARHGLRYVYKGIDLDDGRSVTADLDRMLRAAVELGFDGLNVTHPVKQAAAALVDRRTPAVEAIGALNTILVEGGRTEGHNTDVTGFVRAFRDGLPGAALERVVLLGAGGAGTAVAHALVQLGVRRLVVVEKDPARADELRASVTRAAPDLDTDVAGVADAAAALADADGLVNATPVGMAAHPGSPVAVDDLRPNLWVADIVYRPLVTDLLRGAGAVGCRTLDGAGMAVHQAADAFELFTGRAADRARDVPRLRRDGRRRERRGQRHHTLTATPRRKEHEMTVRPNRRGVALAACAVAPLMVLAACGGDDEGGGGGGEVTISLAHSYTETQPQHRCGAQVIADEVEKADAGMKVEIFSASQLGADADRIASVVSGDIDIDIQGASALGAVYEPVAVVDAAYAFDDGEHLARFFESDDSDELIQGFADETGVLTLGAWSAGMRHFTANDPIREPADLDGLRMRFPNSPQFLMNAEALGADATEVAYEELFLALQQGTVDGQENPITNIDSSSLVEVQDYLSLSSHQANSNLVIIGGVWEELSEEQQDVLQAAVDTAVEQVPGCVAEDEEATLTKWEEEGAFEIVDDVDVEAFRTQADSYLRENFDEEQLAVYEAIRGTAE